MTTKKIRKAVIPVTGLGDHRLPARPGAVQAFLTVVDKPLLQYAVEEALEAGITEIIFITRGCDRSRPTAFADHQDVELELLRQQKFDLIEFVLGMQSTTLSTIHVRQAELPGLSNFLRCAEDLLTDDYFAVILPKDLMHYEIGVLKQMVQSFAADTSSLPPVMLAVHRLAPNAEEHCDHIAGDPRSDRLLHVSNINKGNSQFSEHSTPLCVVGRYILSPEIFRHIRPTQSAHDETCDLQQILSSFLLENRVLAYEYNGTRYDCASKLGYVQANVELGLIHPELREDFASYLKKLTLA